MVLHVARKTLSVIGCVAVLVAVVFVTPSSSLESPSDGWTRSAPFQITGGIVQVAGAFSCEDAVDADACAADVGDQLVFRIHSGCGIMQQSDHFKLQHVELYGTLIGGSDTLEVFATFYGDGGVPEGFVINRAGYLRSADFGVQLTTFAGMTNAFGSLRVSSGPPLQGSFRGTSGGACDPPLVNGTSNAVEIDVS